MFINVVFIYLLMWSSIHSIQVISQVMKGKTQQITTIKLRVIKSLTFCGCLATSLSSAQFKWSTETNSYIFLTRQFI